ncbi:hypothetical protein LTS18_013712, partial [Coniosporium uncinatum]
MEKDLRDGAKLSARIDKINAELITRFENIMHHAGTDKTDYPSTAFNTLQMDHETHALIRATEDVLTLTRQMQE